MLIKGKVIKIGKIFYDILDISEDFDRIDEERNEIVGENMNFLLHKHGDNSLHPTHSLKIYHGDEGNAFLFEIIQSKTPDSILNPWQRGMVFRYVNEKKISQKDIKLVS